MWFSCKTLRTHSVIWHNVWQIVTNSCMMFPYLLQPFDVTWHNRVNLNIVLSKTVIVITIKSIKLKYFCVFMIGWSTAKADKLISFMTTLFRTLQFIYYCDWERHCNRCTKKHIMFKRNKIIIIINIIIIIITNQSILPAEKCANLHQSHQTTAEKAVCMRTFAKNVHPYFSLL